MIKWVFILILIAVSVGLGCDSSEESWEKQIVILDERAEGVRDTQRKATVEINELSEDLTQVKSILAKDILIKEINRLIEYREGIDGWYHDHKNNANELRRRIK